MAPNFDEPIDCLPLIPEHVLKKHACHQPHDTRFRAAARLLASLWRVDRQLPIGSYVREDGKLTKLGSRLSEAAGRAGGNFLTAEIAHVARRESAYREIGAMIDDDRLFTNLLSSTAMVLNVMGPLKLDLAQATCVLHELIPSFAGTATQILFEHSPGRGHPRFLADYTAFDALIRYRTPEGRYGFVAIEAKLSEAMCEPTPRHRNRYDEVADTCGLFADPTGAIIHHGGHRAFYRPSTDSIHMPPRDVFRDTAQPRWRRRYCWRRYGPTCRRNIWSFEYSFRMAGHTRVPWDT